jgi:hypothetical protein
MTVRELLLEYMPEGEHVTAYLAVDDLVVFADCACEFRKGENRLGGLLADTPIWFGTLQDHEISFGYIDR